ncbi:galactoside 2-alpha-L-fucosyltransferase 2 isoform X2 [Eurytemora carolleeae]|uniref:galactoside 2-alpha-L-fucosyltransferase 2 isoform X2 n=1 Tax=Eurytemora carolleeae TaxID=1294199 RepID=UPI000C77FC3C|nr:galactoside 2-alpha-L-fucosyltransferase 2 isoform X2 [Eurytemora carolleeae]|eukprot:XP_023327792.1 galactoside 2-alpha-L-fucosyltransferase 2-like isoform X2 [Eurytemora affinis]
MKFKKIFNRNKLNYKMSRRNVRFLKNVIWILLVLYAINNLRLKIKQKRSLSENKNIMVWNKSVEELFPYNALENKGFRYIVNALNVEDQPTSSTIQVKFKKMRSLRERKEEEAESTPAPLGPLQGCPRRDQKYAFIPQTLHQVFRSLFPNISTPSIFDIEPCNTTFLSIGLDAYEKMKEKNDPSFRSLNFCIKNGPNRAKLYHAYRTDLQRQFSPQTGVLENKRQLLDEIKTRKEIKVIGVYIDMEDYELLKKQQKTLNLKYLSNCFSHFQSVFSDPLFLIRCSNAVWCQTTLKKELTQTLNGANIQFVGRGNLWNFLDDFALMVLCDHNILMRTHFSWWIGYLNQNKNYAVFPGTEGSMYGNVKSLGLEWKPIPPSSEYSIQQYQLH